MHRDCHALYLRLLKADSPSSRRTSDPAAIEVVSLRIHTITQTRTTTRVQPRLDLLVPHLAEEARGRPLLVQALATGDEGGVVGPLVLVERGEERA